MDVEIVGKFLSTLPEDDDHPYRTGPWRPQTTEWRADDLAVVEGELPADLDGVYLRNTENPLHPALKSYHPFDGDGMLHIVGFRDGKAFYRNRFVRTDGFEAENEAGGPLWPGLAEPLSLAKVDHGWGARTLLKDASSTDVVVHRGTALTSFYQCGDLYQVDPYTGNTLGKEDLGRRLSVRLGRLGAPQGRRAHRRDAVLQLLEEGALHALRGGGPQTTSWCTTPTSRYRVRGCRTTWPSPGTTSILNDFPLFWDPELLERDLHVARFHRDMPSRFAVLPRRGGGPIQWFEADPTYVLHFVNAYEDGDEIVLDGFFQGEPEPTDNGTGTKWQRAFRFLALDRMQTRLHRWRLNLVTGGLTEEPLSDTITEFGMINAGHARRTVPLHLCRYREAGLVPVRRTGPPRRRHRHRTTDLVRRRGVRQRDGDGTAGGQPRRGRRLPGHHHHRHERRRLLLPGVRRRPPRGRSGVQTATPRTCFERHPFDLGGR